MEYTNKVDGYNVTDFRSEGTSLDEWVRDVIITYYSNGEFFASSPVYTKVPEEKISKIKEKLFDYTLNNLNEKCISRTITFFTMVNIVESIIYDR